MAFLFIWQFILSGPLEIASGYIGFAQYARYFWPGMSRAGRHRHRDGGGRGQHRAALPAHRIGRALTVTLWIGTLLTTLAVIVSGALQLPAGVAFDFPPGAFNFSLGFLLGLGAAARVGIYDYLGYYNICYIGDEVQRPGHASIPRSIIISVFAVALIYIAINLSIIGVVSWREFVPASANPQSDFIVSVFMERCTARGGQRVHAAGAVDGVRVGVRAAARLLAHSLRGGARRHVLPCVRPLHPTQHFPHVSLLTVGVLAMVGSTLSLGMVIDALVTMRILVQFIGQMARSCCCAERSRTCRGRSASGSIRCRGARAVRLAVPVCHDRSVRDPVRPGPAGCSASWPTPRGGGATLPQPEHERLVRPGGRVAPSSVIRLQSRPPALPTGMSRVVTPEKVSQPPRSGRTSSTASLGAARARSRSWRQSSAADR